MGVTFSSFHESGTVLWDREKLNNAHNGFASSVDNSFSTRLLMPSDPNDLPNFNMLSISLTSPGVIVIF